ncbi:integrase catalytic domain-containing protein [Trichonephila clavipes]|nr:integrase catalytic domain-containing protein [Trichonephila clavipes]
MAQRGKCAKLFSDNGKNFVGARNEIKKLLEIVRKPDEKLANYLAAEGIEWKFIPARSPNFGGLWEAAIKSYIANLLGKKNGTMFAKHFKYDIILGLNVLPRTQTYPKHIAGAHLVTRDTTARIIRHENLELAKKFSNALDTGCAYLQGKRIFASSYKQSPKFFLFVVNTHNENTVKVAQWIREFTMDLELQRKRDIESLRQYICSISPNMLQPRIDDAETAGENDAGVDYEENVKQEVNHGETTMKKAGVNNGRVDVGENYETTEATAKIKMMAEKVYFK